MVHEAADGPGDETEGPDASLARYLDAAQKNFEAVRRLPHFVDLVSQVHRLYFPGFDLIPPTSPTIFGRLLLVCHKSLLSSAVLIARLLPEDATPITRRRVEAGLLAAAIKHDPKNLTRWQAFEERTARWDARTEGEKPAHLHAERTYPPGDKQVEKLRAHIGLLSDAYVHITPELLMNLDWRQADTGDGGVSLHLNYFTNDRPAILREFISLAGVHATVLDIFDDCYGGVFRADAEWKRNRSILELRGARLARRIPGKQAETLWPS